MQDNNLPKINFIMLMAKALHRYGASADRIENALILVSQKLQLKADFFSIPTGIFASFTNKDNSQHTRLTRLEPGKINLEKLYLVDKTVDYVIDEKITLDEGQSLIEDIIDQNPRYGEWIVTFSYALIAATIALFINGSWIDCLFSGVFGLVVGFFSEGVKKERIDSIFEGVVAFLVSIGVYLVAHFKMNVSPQIVILSSLIYLIPGLTLTMAVAELASQNLTSGTARLMGAIMVLLKISFGIYIASSIARYFGWDISMNSPEMVSDWIKYIALFFAACGLILAFQARPNDGIWIVVACYISFFASQMLLDQLGKPASSFIAGGIVGALSNVYARWLKRPAMIFLLPAILLLVPGSVGYQSLNFMFADNPVEGLRSAFNTLTIAVALVSGVYFGNVLVRPKRSL
jgi:uncharacterized membrane protein YjjP (DUF1212 family)